LTMSEYEAASDIATGALSHPTVQRCLVGAKTEVPLSWKSGDIDRETFGIDIMNFEGTELVQFGDLKTVPSCQPYKLQRHCESMLYYAQLADYDMALDALGYPPRKRPPYLLCVEQKRPYDVVMLQLTPGTLEQGKILVNGWLTEYRVASETNVWPGYSDAPIEWDLYGADADLDEDEVDE
jgi:hypothetical protein